MSYLPPDVLQAVRKYGPSVDGIAKQYGMSGAALLAKLVQGESGGKPNRTSSAGAKGYAQFTSGSRAVAIHKYGIDPWKDADSAVHAAALHLRGKINGSTGLQGYNPGDPTYTKYIESQKVGDVHGNQPTQDTRNHVPRGATFDPGGVSTSTDRQAAIQDAILSHSQHGNSFSKQLLYDLGSGNYTKTNVRQAKFTPGSTPTSAHPNAAMGPGEVFIAKGADRPGVATSNEIKHLLGLVAGGYGHPLTVTTGTNHNRMTVDGNVSDHWTGHAADIAVPVDSHKGDQIAYHALRTAGMSHEAAVQAVHTGGLFNLNWHGHRVQIIWKTNIGGNHHNHVHVGIR